MRDRVSAWATSLAIHGSVLVLLLFAFGQGHRAVPDEPAERLVYVEPVAPPPLASAPAAPPPPVAAPQVVTPPVSPRVVGPKRVPTAAPRVSSQPKPARNPAPQADAPAAPAPDVPDETARDGGSTNGVTSGTVGGLGDAPMPLQAVATPPELVTRVMPQYPARARALAVTGQVVIALVLDRDGRPEQDLRVVQSVPLLDAAAVEAVRQWRFRPARDAAGRPVRVIMQVPVRFVLH